MDNKELENYCCEGHEVHKELLDKINDQMPDTEEINDLAELFKVY